MAISLPPSKRWLRAGLLLGAGWLVLEYALGSLIAERIGWGLTVLLLSIKGGVGILLVGALALSGLRRLGKGQSGVGRGGLDLAFSLASAILITLPGIVPTFAGIALFAPSVRAMVLRQFRPGTKQASRNFDLAPQDWREVRTRRVARKAKPRLKDARTTGKANPLETKPPSV